LISIFIEPNLRRQSARSKCILPDGSARFAFVVLDAVSRGGAILISDWWSVRRPAKIGSGTRLKCCIEGGGIKRNKETFL